MIDLYFIVTFAASFLIAQLAIKPLAELLREKGFNVPNYRNDIIPVGTGMILILVPLFVVALVSIALPFNNYNRLFPLTGFLAGISLLGLIDDFLGDRSTGGFKGHFSAALKGKMTSGLIKAVGGLALTIVIVSYMGYQSPISFLIDVLLILFFINTVNLLDLAPGRALKFSLFVIVMLAFSGNQLFFLIISLFLPPMLVIFLPDLREESMMGDVGANLIGATLGLLTVITLSYPPKLIILLVIASINLYAEFGSISKLISNNPMLRSLDELGRK